MKKVDASDAIPGPVKHLDQWGPILDAIPSHIALLDEEGIIFAVNESWQRFAQENAYPDPSGGVGLNYLEIIEDAAAQDADARP